MSPRQHRPGKAHFCTCFLSEEHLELLNAPMKKQPRLPAFEKDAVLSLPGTAFHAHRPPPNPHPDANGISPGRALTKAACLYACINQVASKRYLKCRATYCCLLDYIKYTRTTK